MLAAKDASCIVYPVMVSPKLDGIRALVRGGVVLSRSLKPIPNKHVQDLFGLDVLEGFDGELCVGPPNAPDVMQRTNSGVMSIEGTPDVVYHVFDLHNEPTLNFESRYGELARRTVNYGKATGTSRVRLVVHHIANSPEELRTLEEAALDVGFEGAMVRLPAGPYKYGRSTAREGFLVKIKRFEDAEAVIIGVEEMMHNDNEKLADELGHAKRSTHQANKRAAGTLGALICQRASDGVTFNIGTGIGLTAALRAQLWLLHTQTGGLVGQLVKYRHFAASGVKTAPRFPLFISLRDPRDL
jgi:DNA ligase-1